MSKKKAAYSVVVMALVTLFLAQPQVLGFGGVENPFGINPNAQGTKYSGPLTIHFQCVPILDRKGKVVNPCDPSVNHMYLFARLNQGVNYYYYSYDAGVVPYDNASMLAAFHDFIEATLIPEVCTTTPCPSFENEGVALKSVANAFSDTSVSPGYFIGDIVIAIKP
jgi:hypothetical protein